MEASPEPQRRRVPWLAIPALTLIVLVALVAAVVIAPTFSDGSVVLAGAGDIAVCGNPGSVRTAALLDGIPGKVFTLGDDAYPNGAAADFACFDKTWGRFKDRMLPVVGNHEYMTAGASGYFGYFGAAASPPDGYYALDDGAWRIYVLNSECEFVSCAAGSPQVNWLTADLAAHPHQCTLALWHEPRFSTGPHGSPDSVQVFWNVLYAAGADLILNGHDHLYERYLPLDPAGRPDPSHGMTEIIAGTGGVGEVTFISTDPNMVVGNDTAFGVLKLTLRVGSAAWAFLPVAGQTFTDAGTLACHAAPGAAVASP